MQHELHDDDEHYHNNERILYNNRYHLSGYLVVLLRLKVFEENYIKFELNKLVLSG